MLIFGFRQIPSPGRPDFGKKLKIHPGQNSGGPAEKEVKNRVFWAWRIKKWPEPEKLLKPKISFGMPDHHAKEFWKFIRKCGCYSKKKAVGHVAPPTATWPPPWSQNGFSPIISSWLSHPSPKKGGLGFFRKPWYWTTQAQTVKIIRNM